MCLDGMQQGRFVVAGKCGAALYRVALLGYRIEGTNERIEGL